MAVVELYKDYLPSTASTLYTNNTNYDIKIFLGMLTNESTTNNQTVNLYVEDNTLNKTVYITPVNFEMFSREHDDEVGIGVTLHPGDELVGSATSANTVFCCVAGLEIKSESRGV